MCFSRISQLLLGQPICVSLVRKWGLRVILCLTNNEAISQRDFQTWGLSGSKTRTLCPALRLPHPPVPVLQVARVAGMRGAAGETGRMIPRKQPVCGPDSADAPAACVGSTVGGGVGFCTYDRRKPVRPH